MKNMRKIALSLVAAAICGPAYAADTFTPYQNQAAQSPWSGHIEGYLGGVRLEIDDFDFEESGIAFGGASRLNYNFNQHWNIQGDLVFDQLSAEIEDFGNLDLRLASYGAAAHVFWRNPNSFALGGFVTFNGYDMNVPLPIDVSRWTAGAEGQAYFDRFTLYGQLYGGQVRLSVPFGDSESLDLWGARGVVRYFFTDNFRLDGELGYETVDLGILAPDIDVSVFTAALQANYRFSNSPLTVFGRYQYDNLSVDDVDLDADLHKFVVGVRVTFGRDTLLQEDRTGATMDTVRHNLPFAF